MADLTPLARAIVTAAGRVADRSSTAWPPERIAEMLASELAAAWPQPEHAPDWYAGYEAAMIDAARAEAERTSTDGYGATHWTAEELHRHTVGPRTWEHAHEGGHEAHSAVSHDLSDAEMVDYDEDEAARIVALGGEHQHMGGTA